jgi:hypothetical protein
MHYDPDDLFSPVADKDAVRATLAMAAVNDSIVERFDLRVGIPARQAPAGLAYLYASTPAVRRHLHIYRMCSAGTRLLL